jgi:predicted nucleotidyltransferase
VATAKGTAAQYFGSRYFSSGGGTIVRVVDFAHPLRTVTPTLDGDVLKVLAGADAEFTASRIARMVPEGSERGVRKVLDRLVRQGTVRTNQAGPVRMFRLNREHLAAGAIIGLSRLGAQLVEHLATAVGAWQVKPVAAAVFGSVARGEAGPDSDIDILIIRPARRSPESPVWSTQIADLQTAVTKWTGNDARVLEYGADELIASRVTRERVLRDAMHHGLFFHGSANVIRRRSRGAK